MTQPTTPTIEALTCDSPHLETVVTWQHESWGHLNPSLTFDARYDEVCGECGPGGVPRVFVALHEGQPIGTASLIESDMTTRPQLTPWLASVFVPPEWRGQGIASRLVRRVEEEARWAGIERFYLYTPDQQALYARLGWQAYESLTYRGEAVTVMTRYLNDDTPIA
ncbi:GNAT family N-acetyltransferase [Halomonas sp. McH1-25]|uniref:GNAT family N-acetyltransferase n=1 Tax=unclassified Halomonas TaxID=2609666 RepID=UPI001EF6E0C6|nr:MULTISPECIES: GNAT family N-acetyltransferase [unclassified Halomonas]MCG7599383.1 GNAT family N-acetyltransferase [Halomonas sp. McH1-25]MCP1344107.1 GNAT family N-acetyltransferase [Halomonas sp. FL8]MCP1362642.1 GNAT family N-acetyltransferase [Halomonas sp. BBD45]